MTACTRAFFTSQTWPGASTLSTAQFAAEESTTGCSERLTFAGSARSEKFAGISDLCMSLKKCRSMGPLTLSLKERRTRAGAHAERIVDDQRQELVGGDAGGGAIDERIREGEHQQSEKRKPQGEQDEVTQTAVTDGALRPLLEEHERAEG